MAWAVIGWPVVAAAIAAFGVAFSTRYSWAGLAGAFIAAPLCLYLKDMPYLHWMSRRIARELHVGGALVARPA